MSVNRAIHDKEHPFVEVSRLTAQDTSISYEALGLLTYLLSQPDNWDVVISNLARQHCGRDKAYRLLNELKDAGYIRHERLEAGQQKPPLWAERHVHERPFTELQEMEPITEIPETEKSGNGEPIPEKAETVTQGTRAPAITPVTESFEQLTAKDKSLKDKNTATGAGDAPAREELPHDTKVVFRLYEQNIGALAPLIVDALKDAIREYTAEWVCDAIREAVDQNVRRWSYILPILERWKREGKNSPRPSLVKGATRNPPPKPALAAASTSAGAPTLNRVRGQ